MLMLVNVAPAGATRRYVNAAQILELSAHTNQSGDDAGTIIRMIPVSGLKDGAKEGYGPYKLIVPTPLDEVLRRVQCECLIVNPVAPATLWQGEE